MTNLRWEKRFQNLFLDLQTDFRKLNNSKQTQFVNRNGFNPKTYKEFMESALMVCISFGEIIGDLRWEGNRLVIDVDNLNRKKSLTDRNFSDYVGLPRNWKKDIESFSRLSLE